VRGVHLVRSAERELESSRNRLRAAREFGLLKVEHELLALERRPADGRMGYAEAKLRKCKLLLVDRP
jgi:hypothetical protein